jgi:hypothetical protein
VGSIPAGPTELNKMIEAIIERIRSEMFSAFSALDNWCNADNNLLDRQPAQGWTIREILEHITLTNHFLLLIIIKGARKALRRAHTTDFSVELNNYQFDWEKLSVVGQHGSFAWVRPAHMEPTGSVSIDEIRQRLAGQLQQCAACLDEMKNGEGVLYKIRMSVNDIGKIDMYHYIYFLVMHINRHLSQMNKIIADEDNGYLR